MLPFLVKALGGVTWIKRLETPEVNDMNLPSDFSVSNNSGNFHPGMMKRSKIRELMYFVVTPGLVRNKNGTSLQSLKGVIHAAQ